MHNTISNLENIKKKLVNYPKAKIIAVSKTFGVDHITPLLDYGHKTLEKIRSKKHYKNGQI